MGRGGAQGAEGPLRPEALEAPESLDAVLGGKEAELFYGGDSVTRGIMPKGQPGCRADQRGEGVEKEEDRGETRVPSGEVRAVGVFAVRTCSTVDGGWSARPCALCSQASTVRPWVMEALVLKMETGDKRQTWREIQELVGLLSGFTPPSVSAEAGGPCERLHRR